MSTDWRERITVSGQILISTIVVVGFFTRAILSTFIEVPAGMQRTADTFDGALIGAFSAVIGFWIGSSRSSEKKDQTIAETATVAAATAASAATVAAAKP
jgi:predicted membrane-bound mannosyltransferase